MPVSNADTRKLVFPLTNPLVVEGETPDDGTPIYQIEWSDPDPDVKVNVTLNLSLNEFVALATAIDVGRDIAFGTDTNLIWWIWTRALIEGGTLTCEQIIDCIENDPDTQAALQQYLAANGYSQNQSSTDAPTVLPAAKQAGTLLPTDYDCSNPANDMAISRAIVRELNETIGDLFEIIEYITNPIELTAIVTDSVPVVSAASDAASFADWMQENIADAYNAAYTQSAEDTIACAIFCHLQSECDISLNDLIDIYLGLDAGVTPPSNPDDINELIEYILGLSLALSTTGIVAVFHLIVLYLMRFGGDVVTMLGFNSITTAISSAQALIDTSYQDLCDDCPPTETPLTYWMMEFDFSLGQQGFTSTVSATQTVFRDGGWNGTGTPTTAQFRKSTFGGDTYYLAKVQMTSLRRGSANSGTNDFKRMYTYPNINFGGTQVQLWNSNFIPPAEDGNDVTRTSSLFADNAAPFASAAFVESVDGAFVNPTNQVRVWRIKLWGYNHSNIKPVGAIWVNAVP